jgi:hypothetical protein
MLDGLTASEQRFQRICVPVWFKTFPRIDTEIGVIWMKYLEHLKKPAWREYLKDCRAKL